MAALTALAWVLSSCSSGPKKEDTISDLTAEQDSSETGTPTDLIAGDAETVARQDAEHNEESGDQPRWDLLFDSEASEMIDNLVPDADQWDADQHELHPEDLHDQSDVDAAVDVPAFPFAPCGPAGGNGKDPVPMCEIPAAAFPMGSPPGECAPWGADCSNEMPQHEVFLAAYLIDQTEIRTLAYRQCVEEGGCTVPEEKTPTCNFQKEDAALHPINCVDWNGLNAYCQWAGKRLCTEAEWERAATGEEHHLYPWGDEWHDGWSNCAPSACNDGFALTAPVGSFPWAASPHGLLDMEANLMEFTSDWYKPGYYASSPSENPAGPCPGEVTCAVSTDKTLRGTSWREESLGFKPVEFQARLALRFGYPPAGGGYDDVGARCCQSK